MEHKTDNMWRSSKMDALNMLGCSSEDFSVPVARNATTSNAHAEPQQQQPSQCVARMSSHSSLTEGSSCALAHQYHYIQYPAYYQLMHDRLASQPGPSSTLQPLPCRCSCACSQSLRGGATQPPVRHMHQHQPSSDDSQVAVAVTVHQQDGDDSGGAGHPKVAKTKSEQSLLNHSYQALTHAACDEEKQQNLAETTSCDCDLECTCAAARTGKSKQRGGMRGVGSLNALMLSADEITVSESDNNSTTVKRKPRDAMGGNSGNKKVKTWCHRDNTTAAEYGRKVTNSSYNTSQIDIYSDGDGDGTDSCLKDNNGGLSEDDHRPPLPPRPPPRPRHADVNMNAHRSGSAGIKKYVVWCLVCGGFSCLLGILFLGVYFLLHSYTITVGNFETVPTFVPATLLILTGLCIMSLARRKNRYSYLIKLSGACGLVSALTCALVTVTTTVLHMSRLQALRECEYAQKTRTCTCYSDMVESQVERVDKEGVRLVFDSLSDCGVVHGSLYSCLRAIFGLSVAGVLIAVFSCMLVYQLLSHERKKMYWEQLELRCRSLYTSQQGPLPPSMTALAGGRANMCRCCEQCHAHRQMPLQPSAYPWDDSSEPRFWTGQPPGNFYSPNPGGDDLHHNAAAIADSSCRGHSLTNARSRATGWSWPRMPWQRVSPATSGRLRQTPSSPDSQYGFSAPPPTATAAANNLGEERVFSEVSGTGLPYGVWGPPPPYSDPNSPARRGYYQFMQHQNSVCFNAQADHQSSASSAEQHLPRIECRPAHRSVYGADQQPADVAAFSSQMTSMRHLNKRYPGSAFKAANSKAEYANTPSDSDGCTRDRFSNTLPTRKMKKRVEAGVKSIGPNSQSTQRVNVQHVFPSPHCPSDNNEGDDTHTYHEPVEVVNGLEIEDVAANINARTCGSTAQGQVITQRHQLGVENSAFQRSADCGGDVQNGLTRGHALEHCDPTESEVYFADVSSCCNVSVKNDNYYDDANQAHVGLVAASQHCQSHHTSNQLSHLNGHNNTDEDYLAQRFGQRENSVRSRLPFPQRCHDEYDREALEVGTTTAPTATAPNHSNDDNSGSMQKEISRQSMCSVESEAKTEFTDLSPATPCSNSSFVAPQGDATCNDDASATQTRTHTSANTFVASYPYSSESQSLEAHRRSTKNIGSEPQQQHHQLRGPAETQYEVVNDAAPLCKPFNFSAANTRALKGAQLQRPTTLRTTTSASAKKASAKDRQLEKSHNLLQADLDWSDSSGCPNDRQQL